MDFLALIGKFPVEIINSFLLVMGLVGCDFVLGVIASLKAGDFSFQKLPEFLQKNIFPYVGGLLVLALFSVTNPEIQVLFYSAVAATTFKSLFINNV
jgi:hypothetical protein